MQEEEQWQAPVYPHPHQSPAALCGAVPGRAAGLPDGLSLCRTDDGAGARRPALWPGGHPPAVPAGGRGRHRFRGQRHFKGVHRAIPWVWPSRPGTWPGARPSARTLCPSPFGRSSSISRRPSIGRFDLHIRRFLLEMALFDTFNLERARWFSGDPTPGSCWTGSSGTPPCSGMTASSASTSGPSSGPSSCGRWTGNIPRRSAGPCSAGADCITS